ncbi:hypothetical protein COY25_01550 [Candidatus Uhrbacteria bacterium CG_4_10_14_0_2_um_filter_41_7]|uniref:Rod shape-determining protein MreD n=1 Tax=Candidatus Uhrbacteria bacterium CG_4_9_14_3_um_filter_41_35 TaxID=1975034 RepID=A0A2M7XF92_9BACT|nr:MAG: hypothetical protein COV92_01240 [Candidatus Uhrbacteria bacterium CG11_big_fil_rev_8_21_14_0_20_41_9]PIZ54947.1 MAG: hypothetical protein COY25_01550 [Candidatus Uhrbacteria bacterium CG_4_10_14_0_2_um_filter_41_7]PJA46547.1 MAG: hypothetical protein CO173_02155 [Candidatus Uhrbacteria bacterium CG_4_9_14_3_um_filter_41_35]
MLNNIFTAFIFILTAMFEVSFLHTLPFPYFIIPLHFLIGVIVMHRADPVLGAVWFAISGFFLSWVGFNEANSLTYIAVGAIGYFLTFKVFANRSVYALIGLGFSMYFIFTILNLIILSFSDNFNRSDFLHQQFVALFFLVFGLYFGFIIARYIEHLATDMFFIRIKP